MLQQGDACPHTSPPHANHHHHKRDAQCAYIPDTPNKPPYFTAVLGQVLQLPPRRLQLHVHRNLKANKVLCLHSAFWRSSVYVSIRGDGSIVAMLSPVPPERQLHSHDRDSRLMTFAGYISCESSGPSIGGGPFSFNPGLVGTCRVGWKGEGRQKEEPCFGICASSTIMKKLGSCFVGSY